MIYSSHYTIINEGTKTTRNFHVQFSEKNLTGNAGLTHLGRFTQKLGLDKMLKQHISIQRAEHAKYGVADAILMLAMGVSAGAKRISHLAILRTDTVLRSLFRRDDFPGAATFGRIFKLFTPLHCKELSDVEAMARSKVWSKKFFEKITLDMDSTVRGVYGSQEGAAKGYNPIFLVLHPGLQPDGMDDVAQQGRWFQRGAQHHSHALDTRSGQVVA